MVEKKFFVAMKPPTVTYQEKRLGVTKSGKPIVYEDNRLADARAKLKSHLGKHIPDRPYTKGVQLIVKWCFPVTGKHKNGDYRLTKPDTDNLQKLLKDVMTELGYWKDDALVCSELCEKFWSDTPGIYICVKELSQSGYF